MNDEAVPQVSVAELARRCAAGPAPYVLDVREPWEVAIAALPGALCMPLNEIPLRLKELDAGSEIIVMCKVGGRSQRAATFLFAQGFKKVANLQGGIDAWREQIDPSMPAY